jgi:TRAP-type uncharacterized transport system substrate-binding protein
MSLRFLTFTHTKMLWSSGESFPHLRQVLSLNDNSFEYIGRVQNLVVPGRDDIEGKRIAVEPETSGKLFFLMLRMQILSRNFVR